MSKDADDKVKDQPRDPKAKLSRQAYDLLLKKIVNLEIEPGDIFVEAAVAEELGTSRAPVREALKTLTTQGFLRVLPRTGYMVVPVTPVDVEEILHLRLLLEGEAAAMAAERASQPQTREIFDELSIFLDQLEQRYTEDTIPLLESYDANTEFHLGVARAAGSGRLAKVIHRILDEDRRVLFFNQRRARALPDETKTDRVIAQHAELLDIIRSGDLVEARKAMTEHIEQGRILATRLGNAR
jgi:DNA-binding GntR family transcriptional regulator